MVCLLDDHKHNTYAETVRTDKKDLMKIKMDHR